VESSRVRRRPDLAFRTIEGETWIVSTRDSRLHRLNSTGGHLFGLLDQEPTVQSLIDGLMLEFDVDAQRAREDTLRFLDELARQGLVEVLPGGADG
jgi:hypothetical protein